MERCTEVAFVGQEKTSITNKRNNCGEKQLLEINGRLVLINITDINTNCFCLWTNWSVVSNAHLFLLTLRSVGGKVLQYCSCGVNLVGWIEKFSSGLVSEHLSEQEQTNDWSIDRYADE